MFIPRFAYDLQGRMNTPREFLGDKMIDKLSSHRKKKKEKKKAP